jgi:hypothetical protein
LFLLIIMKIRKTSHDYSVFSSTVASVRTR